MTLHRSTDRILAGNSPLDEALESQEQKSTEEQAERWMLALATQVRERLPLPTLEMPQPTCSWRSGASPLTAGGSATGSTTGANLGPDDPNRETADNGRMVVRLQAGELGELALSVDRTNAGLRLLIGVESAALESALASERSTLAEVLRAGGVAVESVSIVRSSEFGTVLAQPRSGSTQSPRGATAIVSEDSEQTRKKHPRKLNLTG